MKPLDFSIAQHVIPEGDAREHVADDGDRCPCVPTLLNEDGMHLREGELVAVVRHNSYDGRELPEVCRVALDALGVALADHEHVWSDKERGAYQHAIQLCEMHAGK